MPNTDFHTRPAFAMWGGILRGVDFHVGWNSMWGGLTLLWVEFYVGWNNIVSGVECQRSRRRDAVLRALLQMTRGLKRA